ncbi:MAG: hypothetical protein ACOC0N_12745 [Chroococcales cyanobacterium]
MELQQQLVELKSRLEAAKGTPAEATFKKIIQELEQQIAAQLQLEQQITTELSKHSEVTEENPQGSDATEENASESEATEETEKLFFQGIGVIYGTVTAKEDGYTVTLTEGNYEFGLALTGKQKRLAHLIEDKPINLRVYPQVKYTKGDRENYSLYFKLVGWEEGEKTDEAGQFILRGIWQFIPQYKRPVMSIYRNQKRGEMDRCKASHLPTIWRDSSIKPFKFNPKAKEQGDRYFCEVQAKFIPKLKAFGVEKLLGEPTLKIPRYIKPVKVMPNQKQAESPEQMSLFSTRSYAINYGERPSNSNLKTSLNSRTQSLAVRGFEGYSSLRV